MAHRPLLLAVAVACLAVLASCAPRIPKDALLLAPENLKDREMQSRYFETGSEQMMLSASAQVLQDLGFNLDESETALGVIAASKHRDATDGGQIAASIVLGLFTGIYAPTDRDQFIKVSLVTKPIDYNIKQTEHLTNKLRQKLVAKITDKTRQVLASELTEGLEGTLANNIVAGITEKMASKFGDELAEELKFALNEGRVSVRVTFQRIILNTQGAVSTLETINDTKIYQEFFDRLAQSVFLEAHAI
jgi:hypothetical protein